ncbi:MAG: hypothetical protein M1823_003129 [Watsoniomyces obsoletus]|nr:MAG: hypothetical protein M1823_003129 [Watsoniomyces obsoletus]
MPPDWSIDSALFLSDQGQERDDAGRRDEVDHSMLDQAQATWALKGVLQATSCHLRHLAWGWRLKDGAGGGYLASSFKRR